MKNTLGVIILAAGKGTRMKSEKPKALAPLLGQPMINYVTEAAIDFVRKSSLEAEIAVVVGHQKEQMHEWFSGHKNKSMLSLAWQREQKGTADAVKSCLQELPHFHHFDYSLIACADTPLIKSEDFLKLFQSLQNQPELLGVAATFSVHDPFGYGRIIHSNHSGKPSEQNLGFHIVEQKDATPEEESIQEVNSGVYLVRTSHLVNVLKTISNENASGEFYLTDLFQDHFKVLPMHFTHADSFLGVNSRDQLAQMAKKLGDLKKRDLMRSGVSFLSPESVYLDFNVEIQADTTIYPNVTILEGTQIGKRVIVESNSFIKNSKIYDDTQILASSYVEGAVLKNETVVGPMARIRPDSVIGKKSKIGNFVEIKKSQLSEGVKVSHLSYIGDAEIGEETNIGCGFITCNYDGAQKHKTVIGAKSFIGSDCQAVAPIEIGTESFVAAGSTITKNVPSGAFAISRPALSIKEGAAKRFLKKKS